MAAIGLGAFEDDARFRLLVSAITDYAIYLLEPDGTVASWNTGAERMKGYAAEDVIGRHFSLFYIAEDRAAGLPQAALATALAEGTFTAEGLRQRRDGTRFPVHVTLHPIRDADGVHVGFAKITRDLTPQKRAEEALRESEQQFRLLVQGVVDYAIYLLDPTGRVVNWNAGAERIKGYSADEIVGRHFSLFYPQDDRLAGAPDRNLRRALDEGRYEEEGWRVRKDGSTFFAAVVIDPIHDSAGRHIGFGKVTRDITERRENQAQLEAARADLFQAQKMEAVGQLTGGMAHDFNNLLMVISSSLELLRRRLDPVDAAAARLVENASRAAERGSSLTSRMLAFARRQDMQRRLVDPGTLVRGMAELLNHSVGPSVTVEMRLPLRLPSIIADPHQLETSILNLAVNARDAMPAGGTMVVSTEPRVLEAGNAHGLPAGTYVAMAVSDTGTGMDAQTLARAVDPFFTTKGVGKGSGLGLSMVHGFAEQLGGTLLLESSPGEGTTATILLPVAQDTRLGGKSPRGDHDAPAAANALKVLAVDDDYLVLMNVTTMLEDLGHEVIEAGSAADALAALADGKPIDLVITDHAMPKMTGAEMIAALREDHPAMPIILASGYADIPGGPPPGVVRLSKPFSQGALAAAISEALGKQAKVEWR
ncbi:hybrid sensor histidine kinase/response regulator [Phreatobacter oligotrophus]|jgi:PAS domain S-box-containing protein|uniref:hybrid sensor histidine kinase/response regulator n=1 Tax=Phreatobacter oligotrophus TaxID=1122261 RepID=UPI002356E0BB|nr:PAS domain-containing sensor histidine kinase [Phreatobacter oligotrophus]MBX9989958.1 PAS domain S-box protein [Phreatobacter oligotrophus]